ncbi:MAG: FtsX-like permease family protein [Brevinematales bacterium]|jgi:putative ABC transport system permease protein
MFYFKLGLRNIIRNFRKTMLTMATLTIGMAAILLYNGSNAYVFGQFSENLIRSEYGHFQIYKSGYLANVDDHPYDHLIEGYREISGELMKIPGVKFVAPRLSFSGLIASDNTSTTIYGQAGNPRQENKFWHNTISNGSFISSDDPEGILAGKGLVRRLSGELGDTFTIMATMKGKGLNGIDVKLKGVIDLGEADARNKMYGLVNLDRAQHLLGVGQSVDRLLVMLDNTAKMQKVEPEIREICSNNGLEYRRWDELAVVFKGIRDMFKMNEYILCGIIISILTFIIANTMSMNLLERMREIGTIRALGTNRKRVMYIFLAESSLIGLIGSFAGIILGLLLALCINLTGGIYHGPSGYHTFIAPQLQGILIYMLVFILDAAVSALMTARRASRMYIAETLRYI